MLTLKAPWYCLKIKLRKNYEISYWVSGVECSTKLTLEGSPKQNDILHKTNKKDLVKLPSRRERYRIPNSSPSWRQTI